MLFEEKINERLPIVREAVDELIITALDRQNHPQDVLLVITHSFYNDSISEKLHNEHNLSEFAFGPADIGRSEETHYEFIAWYFNNHQVNREKFLSEQKTDSELRELEDLSINIEKIIYLKFWEADMIIKYFYQLSLLCQGKNYDWYFKVPNYSREGSKQDIIRIEIRDKLKTICPKFFNLIKETYSPQLRNAIAHSQYLIGSRNIKYLNFSNKPKAYSGIQTLTFEEWGDFFHNTVLVYFALKNGFDTVKEMYYQKTMTNGFLETRITKTEKKELYSKIFLRNGYRDWTTYNRNE
jgi:hypothetical protein